MKDLKKNYFHLFNKLTPLVVIIGLVFIFFWKVVLRGFVPVPADLLVGAYLPWSDYKWGYSTGVPVKNPIVSDSISFTYPLRILGVDLLKSNQWPLWNPYLLQGTPLLADFQSAPFSPTNILYLLFNNVTAWSWQVVLQHIVGFVFCYILLRHWKASKLGSLIGSFSFAFSGFFIIWSQWNAHALATAFLPLILYFEDQFLITKKYKYGVGISISLCLQIFSGYPQIVLYTLMGMGILWLVRIWGDKKWVLKSLFLSIFVALGIGLAAFQVLPANELVTYSQRNVESLTYEWVFLFPKEVITLFAPDYFGNHATQNYWGPKNYLGTIGYVGIVAFTLAVVGLRNVKRREVKFLWLSLVLSLILAFQNPISVFLWDRNVLGLKAGVFYKSLSLFILAVSVGAGFGVDILLSVKQKVKVVLPLIIPLLVIVIYILITFYLYQTTKGNPELSLLRGTPKYTVGLRNLVFPGVVLVMVGGLLFVMQRFKNLRKIGVLLLFVLMIVELFRFGWKFSPFVSKDIVYPTTPVWDFLIKEKGKGVPFRVSGGDITSVNLNVPYKIEFLGGYEAVYPLVEAKFIAAVNSGNSNGTPQDRFGIVSNPTSKLTNLMNMKYLFIKTGSLYDKKRFTSVFTDKSVTILENREVLPRAFVVHDWEVEKDEKVAMMSLLESNFPLGKKIIFEEPVQVGISGGATSDKVEVVSYNENESMYSVQSTKDGFLFVSDTYYPGWKAYVDGKETKILRADFAFRAISVSEGKHTVEMVYKPESFFNGLKISGVSVIVGLVVFLARKRIVI
ncbi:MAG TPA: DUF6044 family protein [Patescibacteria group bacterium]